MVIVDREQLAKNPERRHACVLVLDTSGSMSGKPIATLNRALSDNFLKAVNEDAVARKRLDIAVVSFGGEVKVEQDFVSAYDFTVPHLSTGGVSLMGSAVLKATEMVRERKDQYQEAGWEYYRPLIFLFSGTPRGDSDAAWKATIEAVREGEKNKGFNFFAVGVGDDVDMKALQELSRRPPLLLSDLDFKSLFASLFFDVEAPMPEPEMLAVMDWSSVGWSEKPVTVVKPVVVETKLPDKVVLSQKDPKDDFSSFWGDL